MCSSDLVDGAELDLQVARLYANLAIEWEYDTERALEFHARAQQAMQRSGRTGDDIAWEQARMAANQATTLTRANRLTEAATTLEAALEKVSKLTTKTSAKLRETEAGMLDAFADVARRLGRRADALRARTAAIELHHALAVEHRIGRAHV